MPSQYEGVDILLSGDVVGLPSYQSGNTKFLVQVNNLALSKGEQKAEGLEGLLLGERIQLSWRTEALIRPGQGWLLTVRLKRPRGFVNPSGFDYQAWLLQEGIRATGYVKTGDNNRQVEALSTDWLSIWRFNLRTIANEYSLKSPYIDIFKALLIGDKSSISSEQWRVLSGTGTIHVMAISGLHIGLVAGVIFFLAKIAVRPLTFILAASYVRALPSLLSFLSAFIYSGLAGFSLPTQRALVVLVMVTVAYLWVGRTSFFWVLCLAAAFIVFLDPFAFLQRGFWLSFLAVAVLAYVFSQRLYQYKFWYGLLLTQLVLFVALTPILLILGLSIPLLSPLANFIAVPLLSFILLPSLFLFLITSVLDMSIAPYFLEFSDNMFHFLYMWLTYLCDLNVLLMNTGHSPYILMVLGGMGVLFLLAPTGLHSKLLGACLLAGIFVLKPHRSISAQLTVLDVGQGLSAIFIRDDQAFVYDVGAKFSKNFNIGDRVLSPYLASIGVLDVNVLMISHSDNDHSGGLAGFLSSVAVKHIVAGEPSHIVSQDLNLSDKGISLNSCEAGMTKIFDTYSTKDTWQQSISWDVLWPSRKVFEKINEKWVSKNNNRSCIVVVRVHGYSILFMGDVEYRVERQLLKDGVLPRDVDVLIAPHHGSKTSSSIDFVRWTRPKNVIFSAGYKNRYRHPNSDVVKRYESIGSQVFNTATLGALQFTFQPGGGKLKASASRWDTPKIWFYENTKL